MSRLLEKYKTGVLDTLKKEFGRDNVMSMPAVTKIVLSAGLGKCVLEKGLKSAEHPRFKETLDLFTTIAGQKPVMTKANSASSPNKIVGRPFGVKVGYILIFSLDSCCVKSVGCLACRDGWQQLFCGWPVILSHQGKCTN